MSVRRYDIHGVAVEIASESDAVGAAIDARLRHFRTDAKREPHWRYELTIVPAGGRHALARPAGEGRPVYDPPAGEVSYFPESQALWIDYEDRVLVRSAGGHARVSARAEEAADVWLLSRPLFTIPLVEMLKRHGLYSVHAAAAERDGRALLLPGASGSGKSTLAIALARHGWGFMSDDLVLLSRAGGRVRALAFPDEVDVTDETASWFPELAGLATEDRAGWPKHRIRTEERLGVAAVTAATPAALAFPSPGGAGTSALVPLAPGEALLELVPNVLLTDPAASQAHLDALAELVRVAHAHRLSAGRDFDLLPARLGPLLDA